MHLFFTQSGPPPYFSMDESFVTVKENSFQKGLREMLKSLQSIQQLKYGEKSVLQQQNWLAFLYQTEQKNVNLEQGRFSSRNRRSPCA